MAEITMTMIAPFQYRYTCEHCGLPTLWLDSDISTQMKETAGMLANKALVEEGMRQAFWTGIYPQKQQSLMDGNYNEALKMSGKCPACGSRQSWESKTTNITNYACGSVGFPLLGWGLLSLFPSGTQNLGALIRLLIGWFMIAMGPVSLFFLVMDIVKRSKIKAAMAKTTVRNKPEFTFPLPPERYRQEEGDAIADTEAPVALEAQLESTPKQES